MADRQLIDLAAVRRLPTVVLQRMVRWAEQTGPKSGTDEAASSIDALREDVREALVRADRSGEIIGRLEDENRRLKAREAERRQEPLINAVIALFDDLRAVTEHAQSSSDDVDAIPEWVQSMAVFQRQALEMLRRSNVEAVEPGIAGLLDAERQEVWATVATDTPERDMHVAEVIRLGFEFAGRLLRPAAVKVFCYQPTLDQGAPL
jgi:molecular chaperone GrpE (heat shock protein)